MKIDDQLKTAGDYIVSIRGAGFSLIELLVAIAIVGILTAIAYPQYNDFIVKAGRADGAAVLLEVMERQEIYYRSRVSYTGDLTQLGYPASVLSEEGLYSVSASACTGATLGRCVLLTATALGRQAGDGNLTLDSRGDKVGNWP